MATQNLTLHSAAIVRPLMPPAFATQNTEARIIRSLVLEQWGRNQAVPLSVILDFISGHNHTVHIIIKLHAIMGLSNQPVSLALDDHIHLSQNILKDMPNLSPTCWQSKI